MMMFGRVRAAATLCCLNELVVTCLARNAMSSCRPSNSQVLVTRRQACAFTSSGLTRKIRATSLNGGGAGNDLIGRQSALERAASYFQRIYWAQFADDTYTGRSKAWLLDRAQQPQQKQQLGQLPRKGATAIQSQGSYPPTPTTTKPFATIEALLPATAVRVRIQELQNTTSSLNNTYTTNRRIMTILEQVTRILSAPEINPTSNIRKSFNTYTSQLKFSSEAYTLNLPPPGSIERKRLLRGEIGMLPTSVQEVVTADLDTRDLIRNEILTLVDDIKAEVSYQKATALCGSTSATTTTTSTYNNIDTNSAKEGYTATALKSSHINNQYNDKCSVTELKRLIQQVDEAIESWFALISEKDVDDAFALTRYNMLMNHQ